MNQSFVKYRPSIDKILNEGQYLTPISGKTTSISVYELEEHKTNIYGDIIAGAIMVILFIFMTVLGIELDENEIVFYCLVAFMLLGSIMLILSGIKKLKNSNNKGSLSINSERIRHYDHIKSETITIKWIEIQDAIIKFYRRKNGFDKYLLILDKEDKVIGLDMTYLYDTSKKSILMDDLKKIVKMKEPEYIELRMILGKYMNDQRRPTDNM